jgi:hypothetical protein
MSDSIDMTPIKDFNITFLENRVWHWQNADGNSKNVRIFVSFMEKKIQGIFLISA